LTEVAVLSHFQEIRLLVATEKVSDLFGKIFVKSFNVTSLTYPLTFFKFWSDFSN